MGSIVVTGAAGLIGSHVCEALVSRGDRVAGLDNFDSFNDPTIKRQDIIQAAAGASTHSLLRVRRTT